MSQTNAKRSPTSASRRLLIVDDHSWFRRSLSKALKDECGLDPLQAAHGLEAIRTLERNPDVLAVVSDYRFDNGGPDGILLLDTIKQRWPRAKRMLLSAYVDGPMYELGYEKGHVIRDKALPISELATEICQWLKRA